MILRAISIALALAVQHSDIYRGTAEACNVSGYYEELSLEYPSESYCERSMMMDLPSWISLLDSSGHGNFQLQGGWRCRKISDSDA
jgi:hypothetical protein